METYKELREKLNSENDESLLNNIKPIKTLNNNPNESISKQEINLSIKEFPNNNNNNEFSINNHLRLSFKKHNNDSNNIHNFNNFPSSKIQSSKSSGSLNQSTPANNQIPRTERMPNKSLNNEQDNYKSLPDIHSKFIKCTVFKELNADSKNNNDWSDYKSRLVKHRPNLSNYIGYNNETRSNLNMNNFINVSINKKENQTSSVVNLADAMLSNMKEKDEKERYKDSDGFILGSKNVNNLSRNMYNNVKQCNVSKSDEEFKRNLELFKQTRLDFTPESKFSKVNSFDNLHKNKIQIKTTYDQDFKKLSDICEQAITKANEVTQAKLLSNNMSVEAIPEELREIHSNDVNDCHSEAIAQQSQEFQDNFGPKSPNDPKSPNTANKDQNQNKKVPKIPSDADNRLNNQLLYQKLKELEEKVVSASIQNQKINQIKQNNSTKSCQFKNENDLINKPTLNQENDKREQDKESQNPSTAYTNSQSQCNSNIDQNINLNKYGCEQSINLSQSMSISQSQDYVIRTSSNKSKSKNNKVDKNEFIDIIKEEIVKEKDKQNKDNVKKSEKELLKEKSEKKSKKKLHSKSVKKLNTLKNAYLECDKEKPLRNVYIDLDKEKPDSITGISANVAANTNTNKNNESNIKSSLKLQNNDKKKDTKESKDIKEEFKQLKFLDTNHDMPNSDSKNTNDRKGLDSIKTNDRICNDSTNTNDRIGKECINKYNDKGLESKNYNQKNGKDSKNTNDSNIGLKTHNTTTDSEKESNSRMNNNVINIVKDIKKKENENNLLKLPELPIKEKKPKQRQSTNSNIVIIDKPVDASTLNSAKKDKKLDNKAKLIPIQINRKPQLNTKNLPDYSDEFKNKIAEMIEELYFVSDMKDSCINDNFNDNNSKNDDSFNESIILTKDIVNLQNNKSKNNDNQESIIVNANANLNNSINNITKKNESFQQKISYSNPSSIINQNPILSDQIKIKFNPTNPNPTPNNMNNQDILPSINMPNSSSNITNTKNTNLTNITNMNTNLTNINTYLTNMNTNRSNMASSLNDYSVGVSSRPNFNPNITTNPSTVDDTTGSFISPMAPSLLLCICPCFVRKVRNLIEYEYIIVKKTLINYYESIQLHSRQIKRLNNLNLSIVDQITLNKKQFELKRHPVKLRLQKGYEHMLEYDIPQIYKTIFVQEDEVDIALTDLEKKEDEDRLLDKCTLRALDELIDLRDPIVQLAAKFQVLMDNVEDMMKNYSQIHLRLKKRKNSEMYKQVLAKNRKSNQDQLQIKNPQDVLGDNLNNQFVSNDELYNYTKPDVKDQNADDLQAKISKATNLMIKKKPVDLKDLKNLEDITGHVDKNHVFNVKSLLSKQDEGDLFKHHYAAYKLEQYFKAFDYYNLTK